jgi:hypothetical protein
VTETLLLSGDGKNDGAEELTVQLFHFKASRAHRVLA